MGFFDTCLYFFLIPKSYLKYPKRSPVLSKCTLKYLVYYQVFWVEARHLQDQRKCVWKFVFHSVASQKTVIRMYRFKLQSFTKYLRQTRVFM